MSDSSMIPVPGAELYVADTGETDLPVVLCLHSLFLDGRMFDDFTVAAKGKYRVVRPDFRGQGRSAPATESVISVETCASDIESVMDRLQIGHAHVVVSSMGGDVGLRVAAHRPDLVRSMVVLGSSARAEPADQLEQFRAWVAGAAKTGFTGPVLDMTMSIMFGKTTRDDPAKKDLLQLWQGRIEALPTALVPAMSGVVERGSVVDLLPSIRVPALVISGEECIARPPEWARELAEGLPNAQFVLMPNVGHSPLLEVPEIVTPRIFEFFRGVESGATAPELVR